MGVTIKGLSSLRAKFNKIDPATKLGMRSGVTKATLKVSGDAKMVVAVDTGALRNSLHEDVTETPNSVTGKVGTSLEYAPYVELGTSNMSAQPFLQPSLQKNKQTAKKIVIDEIRSALKGL
jgi:HK97 gp10 family phage protein